MDGCLFDVSHKDGCIFDNTFRPRHGGAGHGAQILPPNIDKAPESAEDWEELALLAVIAVEIIDSEY